MILLGIMGEYLARTYIEVKDRPIYLLKEIVESKAEDNINHERIVQ